MDMTGKGGEITMEPAETPDAQRAAFFRGFRHAYYQNAKISDPETVRLFEQRVEERRKRP